MLLPAKFFRLLCPLSLCLHSQSPSISKPRHTAAPTHASKVDSRWGGMGQMRRYKRKGRRILTRFLGLWGESRHRRTSHRLRNLCDSRSSRTHRSICPIPPQRRPSLLNPQFFHKLPDCLLGLFQSISDFQDRFSFFELLFD